MSTRNSPDDFMKEIGTDARRLAGMLRRFAITLTTRALWQVTGHRLPFDPSGTKETHDAEVFGGIGFYARPPSSGKPQAIAVFLGDGVGRPVVVAVRDEATRQAIAGGLDEGETAVFTDKAIVVIKASGKVEIRSAAGVALPLPTRADLLALTALVASSATYAAFQGAVAALVAGGWPIGTLTLKAE